ncbi:MAG: choice-of-anchor Q domain-containing protein [Planctomycetota bacterium]
MDADGPRIGSGSNWTDAYVHLQDALKRAQFGDEIRVAQGIYKPDRGEGIERGDPHATFQLIDGVTIKGGYAGLNEPDPNSRNVYAFETVLNGDLSGDDVPVKNIHNLQDEPTRIENSYCVITASHVDDAAVMDGVTITGANARGRYGGGIRSDQASPTLIRCKIVENSAEMGGGMCSRMSNPTLIKCSFIRNSAYEGGGMWNFMSTLKIADCVFTANRSVGRGGALINRGGGADLINCVLNDNSARDGVCDLENTTLNAINCTLYGNSAEYGSAISAFGAQCILANCILWGNVSTSGDQIYLVDPPSPIENRSILIIRHCDIQGGTTGMLAQQENGILDWGRGNINADPLFVDADGIDNEPGTEDDDFRLLGCSPCIDAGDSAATSTNVFTDLAGNPRILNGMIDMGAHEGSYQGFVLSQKSIPVPEGGIGTLTLALAMAPDEPVEVVVAIQSGDPDITVEVGQNLIFDSSNYSQPRAIVLAAAEDVDSLDGSTVISVSAIGFPNTVVVATELDDTQARILYVDERARGANNGANWRDAFQDLAEALTQATTISVPVEIRVAQGIYKPGESRVDTFHLRSGVALRGGYAGPGEPHPDSRDIERYRTVLSGDLEGNDFQVDEPNELFNHPSRADNSYGVVDGSGTDLSAVLDGFIITGANYNITSLQAGPGGGLSVRDGSPTIISCVFVQNSSDGGGGMFHARGFSNKSSNPTLINCKFFGNASASSGGGLCSIGGQPKVIGCTFGGNVASNCGGAIYISNGEPVLVNCVFSGNSAPDGGGIGILAGELVLTNCTFFANSADRGRALCFVDDPYDHPDDPNIIAVDPINLAERFEVKLSNCIVWDGRYGSHTPSLVFSENEIAKYYITFSNVQGGWPGRGNMDSHPLFVDPDGPDGLIGTEDDNLRLQDGSPCIDAGNNQVGIDPNAAGFQPIVGVDIDLGVRRFDDPVTVDAGYGASPIVDMGAYEFASPPIPSILHVNDDANGANTGTSWTDAYTDLQTAFQTAFIASEKVRQIWTAAGNYTPAPSGGERTASFRLINGLEVYGGFDGRETERAQRDPANNVTILSGDLNRDDFARSDSGNDNSHHVLVASGADSTAVLDGFTISGGNADLPDYLNDRGGGLYVASGSPRIRRCEFIGNSAARGGAIYCERSSATFTDCTFADNTAMQKGGGIYCYLATPVLDACTVRDNIDDGAWIENSIVQIIGSNNIAGNTWTTHETTLEGDGTLQIESDVSLGFEDSRLRCNVTGPGILLVSLGSELTVESDAEIDLGRKAEPNGWIICDGLLRVKDDAIVSNAQVNVTRASFEDNAILANCVMEAEAGAPYGQFFIEDNVQIWLERIEADGDRYLDLDPTEFDCNNIHVDAIDVRITEGTGGTYGGLFEARGRELETAVYPPGEFFCQIDVVPDFGPSTWTLDQLHLAPGAKVNLTNRFDFQAPYDWGGHEEVLYVKEIILGPGSVLNTAFNRVYYETLLMDPTAKVVNVPLLGFSLNNISFDDENEFLTRVKHNNFERPEDPTFDRIHIERVEGLEPDPNGMMRMCNLADNDPESPTYGQVTEARAKGLFAKSREDVILIHFEYLFETLYPDVSLVVYLTDVPELLDHSDPDRANHYIKVARLSPPPAGRPGSSDSGRFGVFKAYVKSGDLDFIKGTQLEFELVGPAGSCVLINNWDPQVHCSDLYCGDVTGDHGATVLDYLTVIANVGSPAGLLPDGTSTACLEFGFGVDGRIDTLDVSAWSWMLSRDKLPNLCDIFLTPAVAASDTLFSTAETDGSIRLESAPLAEHHLDALLIAGKNGGRDDSSKLKDSLYVLNAEGQCVRKLDVESSFTNGRLVMDGTGDIYQVSHEKGLLRLSDGAPVIPPASFAFDTEPRYGSSAQVSIGLHSESIPYDDDLFSVWTGRPILDAAFDTDGYVYVVPVVVNPDVNEPYEAAAKLQLLSGENPPYRIVQLYDDPPAPGDNRDQHHLREVEVSDAGSLYVINAGNLNESDILWEYDTNTGQMIRFVELGSPNGDCYLPAPAAMRLSKSKNMLYIASSENDPDAISTSVNTFYQYDLGFAGAIDIYGMGHVTDITDDPETGTLWVVGFTMLEIPDYLDSDAEPFYTAHLAKIPYGSNEAVEAVCLYDSALFPENDLALPLSIIWTAHKGRSHFTQSSDHEQESTGTYLR